MGLALVSPWIIGFLVFTAYPLFHSLYLSFTESNIFGATEWVGLDNYMKLFTLDFEFWPSVRITLLYALLSLPIGVIGALLIAMLLNNKIKGIGRSGRSTSCPPSCRKWLWPCCGDGCSTARRDYQLRAVSGLQYVRLGQCPIGSATRTMYCPPSLS